MAAQVGDWEDVLPRLGRPEAMSSVATSGWYPHARMDSMRMDSVRSSEHSE